MRGNNEASDVGGLKNEACDTNRAAGTVAVLPVMCADLLNTCNVNGVETSPLHSRLNLRLGARDRYKIRIGT